MFVTVLFWAPLPIAVCSNGTEISVYNIKSCFPCIFFYFLPKSSLAHIFRYK